MKNHMEKKIENDMETRIAQLFLELSELLPILVTVQGGHRGLFGSLVYSQICSTQGTMFNYIETLTVAHMKMVTTFLWYVGHDPNL